MLDRDDSSEYDNRLVYRVQIYKRVNNKVGKDTFELLEDVIPRRSGGKPFDYIPFRMLGIVGSNMDVDKSPILDLANVNLSHYRSSADLEHGRHWTAVPTPWAAGFELGPDDVLKVGSSTAWVTENPQARAGYLEFSGNGLSSLENALKEKQHIMAVLGARLLDEQKREAETAEALRLRQSGDNSVLSVVATSVSQAFEDVMRFVLDWKSGSRDGDISISVNTDFLAISMDSKMLVSLMTALQAGDISWDTFFYNMSRGELVPEGRTADQELALIETASPRMKRLKSDMDDDEPIEG
jgi:hypothetical protein